MSQTANLAPAESVAPVLPLSAPDSLALQAAPFTHTAVIPYFVSFSGKGPVWTLDPRTETNLVSRVSLFESVRLERVEIQVNLLAGLTHGFVFGVNGDKKPTNMGTCQYYNYVGGAQYGVVQRDWTYPADSPFSSEIKATVLGNPSPRFHFELSGHEKSDTTVSCFIRINLHVKVAGAGVPAVICLG
jgi:hypothetical protein